MQSQLLFLHGAGTSDENITQYLQNVLERNSVHPYSFNFTGHGGGVLLSDSSLEKRYEEAKNAIKAFNLPEPLNICGSSMGGYIAIKLLEEYDVQNLILFAPAVYTPEAFNVPFNEKFTEIIRQPQSWRQSDAFQLLQAFTGNVLIFIGDNDEVIPRELIESLRLSLIKANGVEIIHIPNCPHKIHRWISQHEQWIQKVSNKITQLLK